MSSPAQIKANRANAQLSTGPKTPEGKQKIAHNAVKTALTGATVLLPTDDVAHYQKHIATTFELWQPANQREEFLVQSIADTEWRLLRIPALQAATLALGRIKHADLFADQPDEPALYQRGEDSAIDLRPMLLEAHLQEACTPASAAEPRSGCKHQPQAYRRDCGNKAEHASMHPNLKPGE